MYALSNTVLPISFAPNLVNSFLANVTKIVLAMPDLRAVMYQI